MNHVGTITVRGGWVSPNRTQTQHWSVYSNHKRRIKTQVAENLAIMPLEERDSILLSEPRKRYLRFTVGTKRSPDPDNLTGGLKILIDCLKKVQNRRFPPETGSGKRYKLVQGPFGPGVVWDDDPQWLEILEVVEDNTYKPGKGTKLSNVVIVEVYE